MYICIAEQLPELLSIEDRLCIICAKKIDVPDVLTVIITAQKVEAGKPYDLHQKHVASIWPSLVACGREL